MQKLKEPLLIKPDYRMKRLAKLCCDSEKVLDIGWVCQPNEYLRNPQVIGLDLLGGDIPENYTSCLIGDALRLPAPFAPGYFDAIIVGEVLEHVEVPIQLLRSCYATMAKGGRLILSTPNPNYPVEQILTINLSRHYFYDPEHVSLYPQRWLIRMFELAGFCQVRLLSGGIAVPALGHLPFPRPWCYQTIAVGVK